MHLIVGVALDTARSGSQARLCDRRHGPLVEANWQARWPFTRGGIWVGSRRCRFARVRAAHGWQTVSDRLKARQRTCRSVLVSQNAADYRRPQGLATLDRGYWGWNSLT